MVFFSPITLNVGAFKINAIDNGSFINTGSFFMIDRYVSYKRNQSFGDQDGDGSQISMLNGIVFNPNVIDGYSQKNSVL